MLRTMTTSSYVTLAELDAARADFAVKAKALRDYQDAYRKDKWVATLSVPVNHMLDLQAKKNNAEKVCEWLVLRWIAQGCKARPVGCTDLCIDGNPYSHAHHLPDLDGE